MHKKCIPPLVHSEATIVLDMDRIDDSTDANIVDMVDVPFTFTERVPELISMIRDWLLSKEQMNIIHPDKISSEFSTILHSFSKAGQLEVVKIFLEEFVLVSMGV